MIGARRLRRPRVAALAFGLLVTVLGAAPAAAQIGYDPEKSPYEDAPFRQALSFSAGWWQTGRDPAEVSPGSAPVIGARYDWAIGSAGSIYLRQQVVLSSREPIDPFRAPDQRALGRFTWPLSVTDVGFNLQFTGQKTRSRLIPSATLGLGVLTDFIAERDVGGFAVGTSFMFSGGLGLTAVVTPRWRVRAEWGTFVHRYRYPDTYYAGNAPVLVGVDTRAGWRFNQGITTAVHWTVFR
jgi:hypothetical protein